MSSTQFITFSEIPNPWGVPGSLVEVRPDYANVGILPIPARMLIIAQSTSGGSALPLTLIKNVTRAIDGRGLSGAGSIMDGMIDFGLRVNKTVPIDIICVADAAGSAKAVWTHTFTGPATQSGTPAMKIEGQRVQIGTLNGDTASIAATEWAAAINAIPTLPVTATVAGAVVTVTAKNAGLVPNDISFVPNPDSGDAMPAGLTVTVAQTVQGATNPDVTPALALVMGLWYTDIVIGWQDTTNIAELAAEAERRFNAMIHQDARIHVPFTGTFSQVLAKAGTTNARFVYASPTTAPGTGPWKIAASAAGNCAARLTADPSRQLDQAPMAGCVGPQRPNLPDDNEKQLLQAGGCSIFHVQADGSMLMHRYVSTYEVNAQGNIDPAWHDVMEQAVASRIRYDWKAYFRMLYPSNKLADDGSTAAANDPTVCTPKRALASWSARMMVYAANGWVEDELAMCRLAVFVRDPNDKNRLNYYIPYQRIGNLMVDAGQLVFEV